MMCALCWSVWNHMNELSVLRTITIKSDRNMVLLIHSTVTYWTEPLVGKVKEEVQDSMPDDMDCIVVHKEFPLVVIDAD